MAATAAPDAMVVPKGFWDSVKIEGAKVLVRVELSAMPDVVDDEVFAEVFRKVAEKKDIRVEGESRGEVSHSILLGMWVSGVFLRDKGAGSIRELVMEKLVPVLEEVKEKTRKVVELKELLKYI